MDTSRRIFRNVFWLALEPSLRLLIAIPLAGFVAHELGVTGYGELGFALSFVILFAPLVNLGLTEVLFRTVAKNPPDLSRLWSSTLALKGILLALYLLVCAGAAVVLGHPQRVVFLILLLGCYQGLLSLDTTARGVFGGNQEMKQIARLSTFRTILETALTVSVLLLGGRVMGLAVSRVALGLVGLAATIHLTSRFGVRLGRPSARLALPLLAPGLSFAAIAALRAVNERAGILVLEHMRGLEAVALFSAANAPIERIFMFLPAVELALFPFFSSLRADEESRFAAALARALRYQAMLAAGLGVAVSLLAPWLLRLIFPRAFQPAGAVLEVLGIGVALRTVNHLLTTAVTARGFERIMGWILALQCAMNVGMALLLVPRLGPVGLGWALAASETSTLGLLLLLLARRDSLQALRPGQLLGPALAGLAVYVAFDFVTGARASIVLPIAFAALYPVLLLLSGSITRDDRGFFLGLVTREARQ
jgi:O-antigen/teichoic acid export membrane protein